MKTISDHPLLIGQLLQRFEQRRQRRGWLRRFLGLDRAARLHVARISPTETIYSHGR